MGLMKTTRPGELALCPFVIRGVAGMMGMPRRAELDAGEAKLRDRVVVLKAKRMAQKDRWVAVKQGLFVGHRFLNLKEIQAITGTVFDSLERALTTAEMAG